ncbi:MAG: VWA domain-containing protein, partial [Pyrinomonadaceae bacterium]
MTGPSTSKAKPVNLRRACFRFAALCFVSSLFALPSVTALQPGTLRAQEPAIDDEVLRVDTNLLVFPIRIRDKRGPAAATLTERDLLLKDEHHVTRGLYLYPGADRVSLVLALDQSGSLREVISQQREAATALFGRFNERSQIAVIRFGEKPSLAVPFGKDISAAREAFTFAALENQRTAIFDAAAAAVTAFEGLSRVRSERRIVILISDGLDNSSRVKASTVIAAALFKQISFYVIHLPLFEPRDGRLAVRTPAKGFRELAEKTGGKYFLAGDARSALARSTTGQNIDLTPVFRAIEEDLRSQYLLGFYIDEGARASGRQRFTLS